MTKPLDLEAIDKKWLGICGACDAGIGACTHPDDDYRPVVADLVDALRHVLTVHARNPRFPYYCVNCRSFWPCKTIGSFVAATPEPTP